MRAPSWYSLKLYKDGHVAIHIKSWHPVAWIQVYQLCRELGLSRFKAFCETAITILSLLLNSLIGLLFKGKKS